MKFKEFLKVCSVLNLDPNLYVKYQDSQDLVEFLLSAGLIDDTIADADFIEYVEERLKDKCKQNNKVNILY